MNYPGHVNNTTRALYLLDRGITMRRRVDSKCAAARCKMPRYRMRVCDRDGRCGRWRSHACSPVHRAALAGSVPPAGQSTCAPLVAVQHVSDTSLNRGFKPFATAGGRGLGACCPGACGRSWSALGCACSGVAAGSAAQLQGWIAALSVGDQRVGVGCSICLTDPACMVPRHSHGICQHPIDARDPDSSRTCSGMCSVMRWTRFRVPAVMASE